MRRIMRFEGGILLGDLGRDASDGHSSFCSFGFSH